MQTKNQIKRDKRGKTGFGSFNAYWPQAIGPQQPEITLFIDGKVFSGLLNTGAGISVITASQWTCKWPKTDYYTAARDWSDLKS